MENEILQGNGFIISFQDNDFILIICLQVTADGSINCANQPDEQESVVAQLCFCEAVTAINLLSQGGNFVFKMFTAFEHQMISLLYLFTCLFQEVHVIKPGKHWKYRYSTKKILWGFVFWASFCSYCQSLLCISSKHGRCQEGRGGGFSSPPVKYPFCACHVGHYISCSSYCCSTMSYNKYLFSLFCFKFSYWWTIKNVYCLDSWP